MTCMSSLTSSRSSDQMDSLENSKVGLMMEIKGIKIRPGKYSVLEGSNQILSFEKSAYQNLYKELTDEDVKSVTFFTFLPYLFMFFLSKMCNDVETRYINFHKTLGVKIQSKYSLYNLFLKHGLSPESLTSNQITYEMAEKVVVELTNSLSDNLTFEDVDVILHYIKEDMKIDFTSSIETFK